MRLVKLLNRSEGIRNLLWTFIKSFQVGRIFPCVLFVFSFVYLSAPTDGLNLVVLPL